MASKVSTQAATIKMPPRPMMAGPANDRLCRWYSRLRSTTSVVATCDSAAAPSDVVDDDAAADGADALPWRGTGDVAKSSAKKPTTHMAAPKASRKMPPESALHASHTQLQVHRVPDDSSLFS